VDTQPQQDLLHASWCTWLMKLKEFTHFVSATGFRALLGFILAKFLEPLEILRLKLIFRGRNGHGPIIMS